MNHLIPVDTIDFSGFNHLVGSNEFDADMNIVESFVRSYNQPKNILAQNAVFNYYISQFLNYWEFTKEYIKSDKIIEDLKRTGYHPEFRFSDEDISTYETKILSYLNQLITKFTETQKVDTVNILTVFEYIAAIACLNLKSFVKSTNHPEYYPLPNAIGIFGLNTYLYAFFEGIYLIGVPTITTFYDQKWGCPYNFMRHDRLHSYDIQHHLEEIEEYEINNIARSKIIYYTILNDPNLTRKQVECHITNLWVLIHELDGQILNQIDDSFAPRTKNNFTELYNNTGQDFYPLYQSFQEFIMDSQNIDSFFQYTQTMMSNYMYKDWKRIADEIQSNIDTGTYTFKTLYILASWYTAQYINKVQSQW